MTRIVEHRSALPFGTIVEIHVHRDLVADAPVLATVDVTKFSSRLDPESFVDPLPVSDAFLQALAYAERAGIACVWIDDPDGHFPPEKRPVHAHDRPDPVRRDKHSEPTRDEAHVYVDGDQPAISLAP